MYRTLSGIVAALLVGLLAVGLTFSAADGGEAEFRFVNGAEPKTLDPQLATGSPEGRILSALFEGLTRRDAATLEPVPGVAERWDLSADERHYTFHLRRNARWSDGTPITAHDFVYAWKRLLDPAFGAEYAYIIHMIRHAEAFNTYASLVAALRGPIHSALVGLKQQASPTVEAADFQRTLSAAGGHAALQQAADPFTRELITRRQGHVSIQQLDELLARLEPEAERLEQDLALANAHLGKDQGFYATNDHTLVVELRAPTPYFLELTAFYPTFPVPRHLLEKTPGSRDWFLPETLVSNGPFNLARWLVNDRIRLLRSQTYWDSGNVKLASADALPIENSSTALNLYLTGEVHWLPGTYPIELVHRFRGRPDFYSAPAMSVYYYRLNCERGPLRDKRVRRALNLAIDRKVITDDVLALGQLPAHHIVPPDMPHYQQPKSELRFDPTEAKRLLADAGYPEGRGFPQLGILYNTLEAHKKVAEVVADQLRAHLNIQVNAYNQEWQSYQETVRAGDYDMARAGWIGDYLDPNTFLDMWVTNGGNNQTGFSSVKYDSLIRAASDPASTLQTRERTLALMQDPDALSELYRQLDSTSSDTARTQLFRQLRLVLLAEAEAVLVQEEFPLIPIYFYVNSGFISPKVSGFYSPGAPGNAPNPQDLHPLYSITVAP